MIKIVAGIIAAIAAIVLLASDDVSFTKHTPLLGLGMRFMAVISVGLIATAVIELRKARR